MRTAIGTHDRDGLGIFCVICSRVVALFPLPALLECGCGAFGVRQAREWWPDSWLQCDTSQQLVAN